MCVLKAQNAIDPISLGILTNPSNSTAINTNPNKFLKSWNWYQLGAKLDEALSMNAGHDYNIELNIS